jgi:DNA-binding NtrC family response regulator
MSQRILVADDDISSLEGLCVLLVNWGYQVETASNGRVALQKISAAEPKAVITDVVMPMMNGLDLLRALRIERPAIPVIVLTGQGSLDTLMRATQQGAYAYLLKPVDVGRLKSVLASALAKPEGGKTS